METANTMVGPAVNEISSLVTVDRSIKPAYPDWFKSLSHPDLECAGPAQFDIRDVECWISRSQATCGSHGVEGHLLYERIKETGVISSSLNLQDGLAIQVKGGTFFEKYFVKRLRVFLDKTPEERIGVFLWASAAKNVFGHVNVPFLKKKGDEVPIEWRCVNKKMWFVFQPALHLPQK